VGAVRKAALLGGLDNVGEHSGKARRHIGKLQFAHPRRVEQPAAMVQPMHFPHCRGVPSGVVGCADGLGRDSIRAAQCVDQRGFADAGRSDKRDRLTHATPARQAGGAGGVFAIDAFHLQSRLQIARRRCESLWLVGQIGLGQDDYGMNPYVARQDQITLQPGNAEILIAGGDDEQRIDIGSDQLRFLVTTRRAPFEQVGALQDMRDLASGAVDKHPVADSGMILRRQAVAKAGLNV